MKRILKIFFLLISAVLLAFALAGCGGTAETTDKNDGKNMTASLDLPEWFLNPPIAKDALYASGTAESKDMNMALTKASDWARQELARMISTKVSTMTKQFLEEAGVDDTTQTTNFAQVVSKSLASNTISGSKISKRDIKPSGEKYKAYVLVELSLADMAGAMEEIVKANNAAYAKLQATKAFDDLAKEIDKLEGNDYGKATTPPMDENQ